MRFTLGCDVLCDGGDGGDSGDGGDGGGDSGGGGQQKLEIDLAHVGQYNLMVCVPLHLMVNSTSTYLFKTSFIVTLQTLLAALGEKLPWKECQKSRSVESKIKWSHFGEQYDILRGSGVCPCHGSRIVDSLVAWVIGTVE